MKRKTCCSLDTLKRHLPCLNWIPHYQVEDLVGDVISGITVGILVIPQAIAYGFLSGLGPHVILFESVIMIVDITVCSLFNSMVYIQLIWEVLFIAFLEAPKISP